MTPASLRQIVSSAVARLQRAGVETPLLDADLLLAHALGCSRTYLYAHPEEAPAPGTLARFEALLARRVAREPLPYLLGEWEWMGMRLRVTPGALIPRPETETLVEEAAARLPERARILDVGAGTGCIGLGMVKLVPGARVIALEPSAAAATVARENLARYAPEGGIELIVGHFPEAVPPAAVFDAIVSNPPYIPTAEVDRLPPELRLHEPRAALDGGADGLDLLRSLAREGARFLRPGGLLAVEVAQAQAPALTALLADQRWVGIEVARDLAGIERVVLARAYRPK